MMGPACFTLCLRGRQKLVARIGVDGVPFQRRAVSYVARLQLEDAQKGILWLPSRTLAGRVTQHSLSCLPCVVWVKADRI